MSTIIIGDGPAGLSAAIFLAKSGQDVTVFGPDNSPLHKGMLLNYLGIQEITGTEFQQIGRKQAVEFGANILEEGIVDAKLGSDGFHVITDRREEFKSRYLILACGKCHALANGFGLEANELGAIPTDKNGATTIKNLYVVGGMSRAFMSQAIIAAGDGAAAALAILSDLAGKTVRDYDVVSND